MDAGDGSPIKPVALLGMSGAGKSHLTRGLAQAGFPTVSIDQVIADRLSTEDGVPLPSLAAVAEWMGFPSSPTYGERSARYLRYEADALEDALHRARDMTASLIIDTTGSVIYLPQASLKALTEHAITVHLTTPETEKASMLATFRQHPTPLIWGDQFEWHEGEDVDDALRRSHPRLLDVREAEYARWSSVSLPYETRRRADFDPTAFVNSLTG